MTRKLSFAALAAALVVGGSLTRTARADTITLRDGTQVTGKIVNDTGDELVVDTGNGQQRVKKSTALSILRDSGSAPAAPSNGTPSEPKKPEAAPEAVASSDEMPEVTKLEREGLVAEGQGRWKEGMEKFEQALEAAIAAHAPSSSAAPAVKDFANAQCARIEFLLTRCAFFWGKLSEHERGAKLLQKVIASGIHPYAIDKATWYLLPELRALGKAAEAEEASKRLGFATQYYVMGSFDNERGNGFGNANGPETEAFDPNAKFKGKEREVTWRPVPASPFYGDIDLGSMLRPHEQSLAYAITYLNADADTNVALRLGSKEALKVWVNRSLLDAEEKRRPLGFDQSHVAVALKKGWNEVLIKVCNQTGAWAFRCRVTAPEGGPVAGVRWATHDEIKKTQTFPKDAITKQDAWKGAVTVFEAKRKADPKDAWSRFRLGYLYFSEKPHDENEHLDRVTLDEARQLDPQNAYFQVFYSYTAMANAEFSVNKEENKRRQALEKAIEIKPDYAEALWLLATYYQESLGNRFRTRQLAEQAIKANPDYLDVQLMLMGLDEHDGLQPLVEKRLRELSKTPEAKTYALLVRWLVRDETTRGRAHEHWERLDDLFALNKGDAGPLLEQAQIANGMGRPDLAVKHLERAAVLSPWNTNIRMTLASTREVLNDLPGSEQALRDALNIAPEDDTLLQRLGHLLERANKEDEGHKVLARALEINPKLVDLKKYFEYLERKKDKGATPWEDRWVIEATSVLDAAKKTPVDPALVSRLLLNNVVTKVNDDGTSSTFRQEIERVENEEGTRELVFRYVYYAMGEQKATYRRARVYRGGDAQRFEDAQVGESWSGGAGEFTSYSSHSVELPTLEVGDVIETWSRVDDLKQNFFGDYFGADERFAEFHKPIDRMRFIVIAPKGKKLYSHETGLGDQGVVRETREDKLPGKAGEEPKPVTVYSWEKSAIAKIEPEPHMPWRQEVMPKVQVSTFEDWNSFAKWYWGLVKKQQEADDSIKEKVAEITKDCKTDEEKIRKIYNFVVTDIRYNSAWEFGVHGFKPYNATLIFARKFGDCKDKATLINTMLAEVNIKSYPVLVTGANPRGEEDLSLPLMQHFNHCISYVPGAKDGKGMWLDGTAQYHPFDTLPTMDYGATTLIVMPEKGELKTIPFRSADANLEREHHEVKLAADGSAIVRSTFEGSGDFNWYVRSALMTKGRRAEVLEKAIGSHYAGAKVKKVECTDLADIDKPVKVEVEVGMPKLLQKSTGGLALDEIRSWLFDWLYLGNQKVSNLAAKDKRDFDVVLEVPSGVEEETIYELPPGTEVKNLPKATTLQGEFGSYEKTFKLEGGKLKVMRKFNMSTNRIPKAKYEEFRKFVGTIERAENERVILSKEGGEE